MTIEQYCTECSTPEGEVAVPSAPPLVGGGVWPSDGIGESTEPSPTPILITEPEVVFSASASTPLPRTKTAGWLTDAARVVTATVRHVFSTSAALLRSGRLDFPVGSANYLERGLMRRDLHGL
jgi:hypothetical protein